MNKVLVTATNFAALCPEALRLLRENGCEVVLNEKERSLTREEMLAAVGDIDGLIANVETWDEALFARAPRLRVIARFGVGYDCIDLEAARRHGVQVVNCPGLNANAVAEMTVALLLGLVREIPRMNRSLREGRWERAIGPELSGKTLGVLGFGAVARRVLRKLSGFEMRTLVYNRSVDAQKAALAASLGAAQLTDDLEPVLRESDILLLHLPLAANTAQLINAETLARMKDGVYLVNTARAALVDDAAMAAALASGRVAGFASDVYREEPVGESCPYLRHPHFLGTPHAAGETPENYRETGLATARAVLAVFAGERPEHSLIPEL